MRKRRNQNHKQQFRTVFYFKPLLKDEYEWEVVAEKFIKEEKDRFVFYTRYKESNQYMVDISKKSENNIRGFLEGDYELYVPGDTNLKAEDEVIKLCRLLSTPVYSIPEYHKGLPLALSLKRKITTHYWKNRDMYYTLNALDRMRSLMNDVNFNKLNPYPDSEGTLLFTLNKDILAVYLLRKK